MTKVLFENASIRDAISKAARIAPTNGSAFDKAAGIHLEIDSGTNEVIIRANDTEVFYLEVVEALNIEGPSCSWLLPSVVLDGICSKLPVTSGATCEFVQDGGLMKIVQGRMRANIRMMDVSIYLLWEPFSPEGLTPVSNFGERLQQVQWAVDRKGLPPLTGININGSTIAATNRNVVAITPCPIEEMYEPVTIPASTLTSVIRGMAEVQVGRSSGHLLLMPDEATQIRAVTYAQSFPNFAAVIRDDEPASVTVKRESLLDMIEQAMVIVYQDRRPILKLIIGQEEFAILMEDDELGLLGNVLDIPGQASHQRTYIGINPDYLRGALSGAPNEECTIHYHPLNPLKPLRVDGGSGYQVVIMPLAL